MLSRAALFARLMREPHWRGSNFYARVLGDPSTYRDKGRHAAGLEKVLDDTRINIERTKLFNDRIAVSRERQYSRYVRDVYNRILKDEPVSIPRRR